MDIVDELYESDAASALTNRAGREIEKLRWALQMARTNLKVFPTTTTCGGKAWEGDYLMRKIDAALNTAREGG